MPPPTKLFTVINGNGLTIDSGTVKSEIVDSGVLIRFKSPQAKRKVIKSFCKAYNWPETIIDPATNTVVPNPINENEFFHSCILRYIRDIVKSQSIQDAVNAAAIAASDLEEQDLP